jgi:CheY-like chemotaxis protein
MPTYPESRPHEAPPRTVLLVEDEASTLRFYLAGLRGLQEFRLLSAANGAEALGQVQSQPVDVVVTDLKMPVLDGYSLIAILGERYPSLPVIVLTAVSDPHMLNRAVELGALRILAKPVRLSTLMDEIRAAAAVPPQGLVHGLPLSSLLQLLNWERRTATLTVRARESAGYLYVREGELVHAACEQDEGLPAALRILGWAAARVEFVETCRVQATMAIPIPELLLAVAVHQDRPPQPPPAAPEPAAAEPAVPPLAAAPTGPAGQATESRPATPEHWFD